MTPTSCCTPTPPPLGAPPPSQILFGSTQFDVPREVGDRYGYESGFARLKGETLGPSFERCFTSGRTKPERRCAAAQTNLEAHVYVGNPKITYDFWRRLERQGVPRRPRLRRLVAARPLPRCAGHAASGSPGAAPQQLAPAVWLVRFWRPALVRHGPYSIPACR